LPRIVDRARRRYRIARRPIRSSESFRSIPLMMTGAILAGILVSLLLLPFIAQESDFRVVRRVGGGDDAAVIASYGYARRYAVYLQLAEHYPGAEFIVAAAAQPGRHLRYLVSFASAGPTCLADGETRRLIEASGPLAGTLDRVMPPFLWEDFSEREGWTHRIVADTSSDRFLLLESGSDIDVVALDLLPLGIIQRCDDRG